MTFPNNPYGQPPQQPQQPAPGPWPPQQPVAPGPGTWPPPAAAPSYPPPAAPAPGPWPGQPAQPGPYGPYQAPPAGWGAQPGGVFDAISQTPMAYSQNRIKAGNYMVRIDRTTWLPAHKTQKRKDMVIIGMTVLLPYKVGMDGGHQIGEQPTHFIVCHPGLEATFLGHLKRAIVTLMQIPEELIDRARCMAFCSCAPDGSPLPLEQIRQFTPVGMCTDVEAITTLTQKKKEPFTSVSYSPPLTQEMVFSRLMAADPSGLILRRFFPNVQSPQ